MRRIRSEHAHRWACLTGNMDVQDGGVRRQLDNLKAFNVLFMLALDGASTIPYDDMFRASVLLDTLVDDLDRGVRRVIDLNVKQIGQEEAGQEAQAAD